MTASACATSSNDQSSKPNNYNNIDDFIQKRYQSNKQLFDHHQFICINLTYQIAMFYYQIQTLHCAKNELFAIIVVVNGCFLQCIQYFPLFILFMVQNGLKYLQSIETSTHIELLQHLQWIE
eukprot:UN04647